MDVTWKETNMGYVGKDEAGNRYTMPANRETCVCRTPAGGVGYDWTPEGALAKAKEDEATIIK